MRLTGDALKFQIQALKEVQNVRDMVADLMPLPVLLSKPGTNARSREHKIQMLMTEIAGLRYSIKGINPVFAVGGGSKSSKSSKSSQSIRLRKQSQNKRNTRKHT